MVPKNIFRKNKNKKAFKFAKKCILINWQNVNIAFLLKRYPSILYHLYMDINPLKLNSQQIFLVNNPTNKQELVQYLVSNICKGTALNQDEVFKAIIKREQGISTTLESGLSIPHARLEGLTSFRAVVAVIPQGVQDNYGKNIKVMFLFLSPSGEQYFPEHLKLLAKLAETFTPAFIEELCNLKTVEEIAAKLPF